MKLILILSKQRGGPAAVPIATAVASSAAGAIITKQIAGKPDAPPELESPAAMPVPDDEESRKAGKKSAARRRVAGGRISTFLSERDSGRLG